MINPQSLLDVPMQKNDARATTIRDYLVKLLSRVWDDGEGFDGKRPFGNSSWECELTQALANAGILEGDAPDEDGWIDVSWDEEERGRRLIAAAILSLGWVQSPEPDALV